MKTISFKALAEMMNVLVKTGAKYEIMLGKANSPTVLLVEYSDYIDALELNLLQSEGWRVLAIDKAFLNEYSELRESEFNVVF